MEKKYTWHTHIHTKSKGLSKEQVKRSNIQHVMCVELREHMINYVDGTTKSKVSLFLSCVKRL
jgi:hypothetical protein